MAWISTQVNWQNNLLFFRNSEWPHPKAWTLSMQSLGFTAEPHLGDFSSSLRSHPEPYAEETGIWTNEEHSMVYVTHSPYQKEHEPELWNKSKLPRKNEKKSMHWILLGSGLNGIHRLMNDLEGMPSLAPSPHNIRKNIDPREIHY